MPRESVSEEVARVMEVVTASDKPLGDKLALVATLRAVGSDVSNHLDRFLVAECARMAASLKELRSTHGELREVVARLSAVPWYPAIYLGDVDGGPCPGALVLTESGRRIVSLSLDLQNQTFDIGEEVLLGPERNVIVARAAPSLRTLTGETASFVRYMPDRRLVISVQDQDVIACGAACLGDSLQPGDRLRWDRASGLVFEHLPGHRAHDVLEETPTETFEQVGGLGAEVARLIEGMQLRLDHPQVAARYGVRVPMSALLVGPPGVGKTLLARAFAHWLSTRSADGRSRFGEIKPGQWMSKWFGESESRIRQTFDRARRAAAASPGVPLVLFFDEIDGLGAARGERGQRYNDQVLATFLAELNTLTPDSGIFVLAATNRLDALDPALTRPGGRLGDLVIHVPRPNRRAARDILAKYLHAGLHFEAAGVTELAAARRMVIDAAVSAIYAPNGLGPLAHVTLRDGTRRDIGARDLASGAVLASIARAACAQACRREVRQGTPGVCEADVMDAAAAQFATLAAALTPASVRSYVECLPQDMDAVRVEPVRRLREMNHYLMTA
ncbi:MAG: AAA family ATPase [Vicinamibacterales bacterium]